MHPHKPRERQRLTRKTTSAQKDFVQIRCQIASINSGR
jgi:hypothetical protein